MCVLCAVRTMAAAARRVRQAGVIGAGLTKLAVGASIIELPVVGNVSYLVAAAGAAAIYYLWSANQTKPGWFG